MEQMEQGNSASMTLECFGIKCKYKITDTDIENAKVLAERLNNSRNNEINLEEILRQIASAGLGQKIRNAFYRSIEKEKWKAIGNLGVACAGAYILKELDLKPIIEGLGYFNVFALSFLGFSKATRAYAASRYIDKRLGN